MITHVTQSFLKSWREYAAGLECGNMIKAMFVDGRLFDNVDEPGAMELGTFFEFELSGALPKSGIPPKPKLNKDGSLSAAYEVARHNAKRIRLMLEDDMGLKIIKAGWHATKGRYSGTIDLVVEVTRPLILEGVEWKEGDRFVIDIKYSGLIGDQTPGYNKLGWKWTPIQKEYHGTQAKQYHFISELPHYFLVVQSNAPEKTIMEKPAKVKFFYTPVSKAMIDQHIMEGNAAFEAFQDQAAVGFIPHPNYDRCAACPLFNECEDKHTFPRPEVIDLNIE